MQPISIPFSLLLSLFRVDVNLSPVRSELVQRLGRANRRNRRGNIWSIGGLACAFAMYHETGREGEKVKEKEEVEGRNRARAASRSVGPLDSLPIGPRIDSRNWPPKNVRYCTMQMHGAHPPRSPRQNKTSSSDTQHPDPFLTATHRSRLQPTACCFARKLG